MDHCVENGHSLEEFSDIEGDVESSVSGSPRRTFHKDLGKMKTEEMAEQLSMVQEMVHDMKEGFVVVLDELSKIQYGDQNLQTEFSESKVSHEKQITELLESVSSLKVELTTVKAQVSEFSEIQSALQGQITQLQTERDVLLDELEKTGSVSADIRNKLRTGRAHRLVKQQSDFDSGVNLHHNGSSGGDTTPPQISPMVQPYIDSLQSCQDSPDGDESDASVIAEANRSLLLSQSLREKYMEVTPSDNSDFEDNQQNASFEEDLTEGITADVHIRNKFPEKSKVAPHEHSHRENQRQQIVRQISAAERQYCSILWTLIDDYSSPLHQMGMMASRDLNAIFPPYISQLYDQHCAILKKLEERLLNWKWNGSVGDIFAKLTDTQENDLLTLYRDYVSDFPAAMSNLNKWRLQSKKFKSFLKNHHHGPGSQGTDVTTLMLSPIQRIPQYILLIKHLLKYTDHTHPDRYYLVASLAILRNFLSQLNDEIQHAVNLVGRRPGGSAASLKSGSSCEVPTMQSARDSGIHSILELEHRQPVSNHRAHKSNINRETPTYNHRGTPTFNHRSDSPYVPEPAHINTTEHTTRPQRKVVRKLHDNTYSQERSSPQTYVPHLNLTNLFEDNKPVAAHRQRPLGVPSRQRPMSVMATRVDHSESERLSRLVRDRPRSAAEHSLLRDNQSFNDDLEYEYKMKEFYLQPGRYSMGPEHDQYRPMDNEFTKQDRWSRKMRETDCAEPSRYRKTQDADFSELDRMLDHGIMKPSLSKSMSVLEQDRNMVKDYGIFGDEDDDDDDDSEDDTGSYHPDYRFDNFTVQPAQTGGRGVIVKAKSQGHMASSPDINDDDDSSLDESVLVSNVTHGRAADGHQRKTKHTRKPAHKNPVTHKPLSKAVTENKQSDSALPDGKSDSQRVLPKVQPSDTAPLAVSEAKPEKQADPVQKKPREKTSPSKIPVASLSKSVEDITKAKKKGSIRESIKSIFVKKRGSTRPMDLDPTPEYVGATTTPRQPHCAGDSIPRVQQSTHITIPRVPQSSTPIKDKTKLTRFSGLPVTYRDANGEPCSSV